MSDGPSHTRSLRGLCRSCSSSLAACLCLAVVVAACDESFDPIAPSDLAFSVFGTLDASADTQWIRVMPLRPLKVTSQDALGTTVTLEHLGTGRIIELRDSLFSFSSYDVHNFWTSEEIEPGATYRFSARREGKEPAEAVVEIPRDYEVVVAIDQHPRYLPSDELRIAGLKHVAFSSTITHFYDLCGSTESRTPYKRSSADDGVHVIVVGKPDVIARKGCGSPVVENSELWIVGSEAAWPTTGYDPGGLGEAGETSNVTNAVGFLGGVLTKLIPYEYCRLQGSEAPLWDYCLLRYGPETATVRGTVTETRCGDGPIEGDTVRLREMDRDPARIRQVLTTRTGEFLIGALEPGIPHVLWSHARQFPVDSVFNPWSFQWEYTEWADAYTQHDDTLTFMPGERVEYNIELERLTPCTEPPPGAR